jgi:hypothetical protein
MADLQKQIEQIVGQAAAQIAVLVKETAIESLSSTLNVVQRNGGATRRASSAAPRAAAPAPARAASARRGKGDKRPAGEIEAVKARVGEFIGKNPGLRIEQINAKLGTQTKDLALPLRKLITERVISTKGQRRATTYYPAGGGAKGGAKKRGRRK